MTFEPFEVLVVPFPFSDSSEVKRRKAFVLSNPAFQAGSGALAMAMITSAQASAWPGDVPIRDLKSAGLRKACLARMKLFTVDEALILESVGRLSAQDQLAIHVAWTPLFALSSGL